MHRTSAWPFVRANRNGIERSTCKVRVEDQIVNDYSRYPEHAEESDGEEQERRFREYLKVFRHAVTKRRSQIPKEAFDRFPCHS